ncbi:MAG: heparinase [Methylomarinum sp.]|nr:heparinase [Methylomarinum sp.]
MMRVKIKTAIALGLLNLGRVLFYRLGVKLGFNSVKKITAKIEPGVFFNGRDSIRSPLIPNSQWLNQQCYFGWLIKASSEIPNWHQNVLTGVSVKAPMDPWWKISDFESELGDIKGVWEASRFDWVLGFSQQVALGDKSHLDTLNQWLNDWVIHNPPYFGVNWKCGQEAAIRVMHLAIAVIILDQTTKTSRTLLSFIKAHLARISPTISYAVAQNNNHGTSEAAALYIGGSWLLANGDKDGAKWFKQGQKWLKNRAICLIEDDGSFSQYSVTYHRVMLDTYSMVEVWRNSLSLKPLDEVVYTKLQLATHWLFNMTQFETGDAPNLGANDGARLLPLTGTDYRDFRPSVQLASVLFFKKSAYAQQGDWDFPLYWLNIVKPKLCIEESISLDMPKGGYAILRNQYAFVLLNYPKFRFRPSQCDALHLDFWLQGENILRDSGTYSYNAGQKYIDYYAGSQSHNTVQFDNHQQMPRLSRFLLGDWLKTRFKKDLRSYDSKVEFSVAYKDKFKCQHQRSIVLTNQSLVVADKVKGFNNKAILRWRLKPGDWLLKGQEFTEGNHIVSISSDVKMRIELVKGHESRYYYKENIIPVIEIEINQPGTITTEYVFKK